MITCDAVSVSLYRNTGVSLNRHAVTHDFAGALRRARLGHLRLCMIWISQSVLSFVGRAFFGIVIGRTRWRAT
jgi:hypothetical protein